MDQKPANQNGQNHNSQNNQSNKPTLSWTQPAGASSNQNTNQNPNKPTISGPSPVMIASTPTQNGWKTGGIVVGIFALCVLAVWGMIALRHKSQDVVSITGSSTDTTTMADADVVGGGTTSTNSAASETTNPQATNPTSTAPTTATPSATPPTSTPGATTISATGSLPITVASPQVAGMSVAVSGVSVSSPTWFVVYQNNNGQVGNALGAGLFLPGGSASSIPLLRATVAGSSYFVGESVDDGDKVFTLHGDPQTKDAQGNLVVASFQAN